jgi:hypothetical protein
MGRMGIAEIYEGGNLEDDDDESHDDSLSHFSSTIVLQRNNHTDHHRSDKSEAPPKKGRGRGRASANNNSGTTTITPDGDGAEGGKRKRGGGKKSRLLVHDDIAGHSFDINSGTNSGGSSREQFLSPGSSHSDDDSILFAQSPPAYMSSGKHVKKINTITPPDSSKVSVTHCNCKKSKCLKLYCDCFKISKYCDGCNCCECSNTAINESERASAVEAILSRNPEAFKPRVVDDGSDAKGHMNGCHCKKSSCLKKYCECFSGMVACSERCRCLDCRNSEAVHQAGADPVAIRAIRLQAKIKTDGSSPGDGSNGDAMSEAMKARLRVRRRTGSYKGGLDSDDEGSDGDYGDYMSSYRTTKSRRGSAAPTNTATEAAAATADPLCDTASASNIDSTYNTNNGLEKVSGFLTEVEA